MLRPGLVSISFRRMSPKRIVKMAARANLEGIEWGGDVHAPHGNARAARLVHRMTRDAGLEVAAYGSYYRAAYSEEQGLQFAKVLDSALELGAPVIRVWAGTKGSEISSPRERTAVVDDLTRIDEIAVKHGVEVACEYHANTLTDTNHSARDLVKSLEATSVRFYWQPANAHDFAYRRDGLQTVIPRLSNLHVFYWTTEGGHSVRQPLEYGATEWLTYLRLASLGDRDRWALLEFFKDDRPKQMQEDAAVLRKWIDYVSKR